MLYKEYNNFISFWQNIDSYDINDKLSTLFISKLIRNYETGDFNKAISEITNYVDQENEYNLYLILLNFSCEILITDDLSKLLNESCQLFELISTKDIPSSKNIFSVCKIALGNIYTQFKEISLTIEDLTQIKNISDNYQKIVEFLNKWSEENLLVDKLYTDGISLFKEINNNLQQKVLQNQEIIEEDNLQDNNTKDTQNLKTDVDSFIKDFASVKWFELIKKTQLLKVLLNENRNFKAAIVYQDIEYLLEVFDPKEYFPGLFFDLFKNIAPKLTEIYRFINLHSSSLQWHIADRLYQTDMDRFVKDIDTFIANGQSDEEFIDYQDPEESSNDRTLVNSEFIDSDSEDLYFQEDDNQTNYEELKDSQYQIDQYKHNLKNDVSEQIANEKKELSHGL